MDINKVWLTGQAISDPVLTRLGSNRTASASFLLQVNERFRSEGKVQFKPNVILVETLGIHATSIMEKVKKGLRYIIEGYLRVDNNKVCVRTFAINREEKEAAPEYYRGIEQALELLVSSRDKEVAVDSLRVLLEEIQNENV